MTRYANTREQKLKYLRLDCKQHNLLFTKQKKFIDGKQAWLIKCRESGEILAQDMTIESAHKLQDETGFIHTLKKLS